MDMKEKTYAQLIAENHALRQRNAELELIEAELQRTEAALRQESDLLRRVMDTSPVGVTVMNVNGQITFANEQAEQVLGLTKDHITARTYNAAAWRITDYDGQPFPEEQLPYVRVMSTCQPVYDVRHAIEWPDGRRVLLSINAAPIFDATAGGLEGIVATIENVTANVEDAKERKRAEEALRRSQETFDKAFHFSGTAMSLTNLADSTVVDFNQEFLTLTGYAREEIIGHTTAELNLWTHPEQRVRILQMLEQQGFAHNQEFEIRNKSGEVRTVLGNAEKITIGDIPYLFVSTHDITDRKQMEEALRRSEQKFRALFETMTEGVALHTLICDAAGAPVDYRILEVNPAYERHTGLSGKEAVGKLASELYGTGQPPFFDFFSRVALTGEPTSVEVYFEPMQKYFRISICSPGQYHFATVFEDITARKQAEDQIHALNADLEARVQQRTAELEIANQDLQKFVYLSSHDLKTPLRGIAQLATWLAADYAPQFDAAGQQQVQLLINRVKRMDNLLNGMLEYVAIGRVVGTPKPIDAQLVVQNVVTRLNPPSRVQIAVAPGLPVIVGEKKRLEQVFQHLLSNAVNFMDKRDGRITVTCQEEGAWWRFAVADNGPGIDPKYHHRIFQMFQTLHRRDERNTSGIGLSIVKKIVELSGGNVWIESAVGQGSTVYFTLPKGERR